MSADESPDKHANTDTHELMGHSHGNFPTVAAFYSELESILQLQRDRSFVRPLTRRSKASPAEGELVLES